MHDTDPQVHSSMPDVAQERADDFPPLDAVGMSDVEMPVVLTAEDGSVQRTGARIDAFVDLSGAARGIHMSRLYLILDQHLATRPLTRALLDQVLQAFLESHQGQSARASLRIHFDFWLRRRALVSDNSGWRAYPVVIDARRDENGTRCAIEVGVAYSSTCPASAALSRQAIRTRFEADFKAHAAIDRDAVIGWLGSADGIVATPHSQRSTARVRVELGTGDVLPIVELVDRIEQAVRTPVQSAVKRDDEQAFALRSGANAMFCEDAARRIAMALESDTRFTDACIEVAHHESLHPHDAVARVRCRRID